MLRPTARAVLQLAIGLVVGATLLAQVGQGGRAWQQHQSDGRPGYGAGGEKEQLRAADPAAKLAVLETRLHLAQQEIERLHGLAQQQQQQERKQRPSDAGEVMLADPGTAAGDSHGLQIRAQIRGAPPEKVNVNFTLYGKSAAAAKSELFVMIITSQGDRSAKQRRLVRETWLNQIRTEYQPARIAAKFFVGRYSDDQVLTDAVAAEMLEHGDTVVVDVGDAYGGLVSKVRAALQWVAAQNPADYVAKFDDDCYVAPANLLAELTPLPKERLYYGKMMAGGPIQRKGNHRNRETALPHGVNWFPPYASGAGYALSWDLVQTVAFPSVKRLDMVNEVASPTQLGGSSGVRLSRLHGCPR